MTELEWTSYQYQKEKKLAEEMCERLGDGHGVFLLNREQMVFVLEAIKDHAERLSVYIADMMRNDNDVYQSKDFDFWMDVCTLLDVEFDNLPDPVKEEE